ncbi:MAG: hypothetical protein KDK44_02045 [Chlamydiia bacterium]|nr:hypothetical protein [Chlamydiia bacterium]MCP5509022.1 hypothetical protein [Chlamydiales bacterium]HPE85488.1 ion channel [Chlamydiales bacterium]
MLFVFRPYDRGGFYYATWQLALTGVVISSIFNVKHSRAGTWLFIGLGIPALIFNWLMILHPLPFFVYAFFILTFIFIMVSSASIILKVILNANVTLETLRGVVCVYFMIAFGFAFMFVLIEYTKPGSFLLETNTTVGFLHTHLLSEMMYFSFVTLLSIGFGTINAIGDVAQTFTILEGMIGQFYVAILVARLIGVYSYYADLRASKKKKELFPEH